MKDHEVGELKNTVRRLEGVLAKLKTWTTDRTWDEAHKIVDEIPLRIYSLEDRSKDTDRLFLGQAQTIVQKRVPTFADQVGDSALAEYRFLDFLRRTCSREIRSKKDDLRRELIEDARYYDRENSSEFKSELDQKLRAIPKVTNADLLRRLLTGKNGLGYTNSEKLKMELAGVVNYGGSIRPDDLYDAIVTLVRNLVHSKKLDITLEELGIEDLPEKKSLTEEVTIRKPVINSLVAAKVMPGLENEIRETQIKIRELQNKLADNSEVTAFLPFEIFPAGEWSADTLVMKFHQNGVRLTQDHIRRLETIKDVFQPNRIAVGKLDSRGYEGYFVFMFDDQNKVIAENPLYGNATYIIYGDWDEILRILQLTKSEVRRHPNSQFVIHRDEHQWLHDLRTKFKYWR